MPQLKNYREVGIFDLLSAPLNPIGAFDAEQFKKEVRELLNEKQEELFLAVDLMGLDFVYSDAYNAFIQFQQEMAGRGGMFAVLTNNRTIVDGLKKAGLDKSIRVFSQETDMMSFSLHAQVPQQPASVDDTPVVEVRKTVASQNMKSEIKAVVSERRTGSHRRFTKSFNAIVKDDDKAPQTKGLDVPFDDEPSSARTVIIILLLFIAAAGGVLAFFGL